MNDGYSVGSPQSVGRFLHDAAGFFHRQLPAPANPRSDRLAVHIPHHEIHQPLALTDGVNRNDVGVGEPGGGLRLAGKAFPNVLLKGKLWWKHLDGDPALKPLVARAVDYAHSSAADLPFYGIGSAQGLGQPSRERSIARRRHRPR
jgi:hypothetical protein